MGDFSLICTSHYLPFFNPFILIIRLDKKGNFVKLFEITIYNKDVRDVLLEGKSHPSFDDGWADQRFIQIEALDSNDARKAINLKYPKRNGFLITDVTEIPNFE